MGKVFAHLQHTAELAGHTTTWEEPPESPKKLWRIFTAAFVLIGVLLYVTIVYAGGTYAH